MVASLLIAGTVAAGQALLAGNTASAATGTFSKAEVNFPANSGLTGATEGLKKFNDVQAGGTASDVSLVLKSPDGAANDWVLDLQPVNGTSGTFTASNTYVDSLIGADATHMRAHLHVANPTGPSCGEQVGQVRIRWIDISATPIPSIALDFKIRCRATVADQPGPEISGSVMYKVLEGPLENPAPPTAGEFVPVTPFRVFDSRPNSALNAGATQDIAIPTSQVPNTAIAVVLNVTAINPADWGYLTAYPTGGTRPFASNLNFKPLQTVPNSVIVKMGTGNSVTIYNGTVTGSAHVAVDVMGYFDPTVSTDSGRYAPLNPTRVLDTRTTGGPISDATYPLNIDVPGQPNNVKSMVLNVTVAGAQRGGYLAVTPGPSAPTSPTSNLNFNPGDTAPNLVVVGATPTTGGPAGRYTVGITVGGSTDVVVDLVGVFTTDRTTGAGRFVPMDPQRIVDTRNAGGALGATVSRDLQLVRLLDRYSSEASGVVFNGTGANASAPTYLRFWPSDQPAPFTSNLNLGTGETRANLVIMGADPYALTSVFNAAGSADVIADAAGWFTR